MVDKMEVQDSAQRIRHHIAADSQHHTRFPSFTSAPDRPCHCMYPQTSIRSLAFHHVLGRILYEVAEENSKSWKFAVEGSLLRRLGRRTILPTRGMPAALLVPEEGPVVLCERVKSGCAKNVLLPGDMIGGLKGMGRSGAKNEIINSVNGVSMAFMTVVGEVELVVVRQGKALVLKLAEASDLLQVDFREGGQDWGDVRDFWLDWASVPKNAAPDAPPPDSEQAALPPGVLYSDGAAAMVCINKLRAVRSSFLPLDDKRPRDRCRVCRCVVVTGEKRFPREKKNGENAASTSGLRRALDYVPSGQSAQH
jgi:hypothetical protein